jgi:RNA polymerase sigma-70 factor (ECF subfamily)
LAVARAIGRWNPDRDQGRFRTWLFRIARNQLIDNLDRRKRRSAAIGGSGFSDLLEQNPLARVTSQAELRTSHRQELFSWAAERVKEMVKPVTWQAFWMTAVDDREPEAVAAELNLTVGAVYIARSRVLMRLRSEVAKWEDNDAM